jgi:hypothetical protein
MFSKNGRIKFYDTHIKNNYTPEFKFLENLMLLNEISPNILRKSGL